MWSMHIYCLFISDSWLEKDCTDRQTMIPISPPPPFICRRWNKISDTMIQVIITTIIRRTHKSHLYIASQLYMGRNKKIKNLPHKQFNAEHKNLILYIFHIHIVQQLKQSKQWHIVELNYYFTLA